MAIKETSNKELTQWVLGLLASILLFSIKCNTDQSAKVNDELQMKMDKVYDYAINHELRMKNAEDKIGEHSKDILQLQLANERYSERISSGSKTNNSRITP